MGTKHLPNRDSNPLDPVKLVFWVLGIGYGYVKLLGRGGKVVLRISKRAHDLIGWAGLLIKKGITHGTSAAFGES